MSYTNSFFSDCASLAAKAAQDAQVAQAQNTAETAATAAASLAVSNFCGETHTMLIFAFITAVTRAFRLLLS